MAEGSVTLRTPNGEVDAHYRVTFVGPGYEPVVTRSDGDSVTARDDDAFSALWRLRLAWEPDGIVPCVQGARLEAWPNAHSRDSGGMNVFLHDVGRPTAGRTFERTGTFEPCARELAVTTDAQRAWHDRIMRMTAERRGRP